MQFLYGRKDLAELLGELKPGEPLLVLRGSDRFAAAAAERYADHVEAEHGDPRVVAHARNVGNQMRAFPDRAAPSFPEPLPEPEPEVLRNQAGEVIEGDAEVPGSAPAEEAPAKGGKRKS